jgi:hypothetical protein
LAIAVFGFGLALPNTSLAEPDYYVVFDLDRTLFDPEPRIARILKDLGAHPDQVQRFLSQDRSALGAEDSCAFRQLFGDYADGSHKTSPFGRVFYYDSSYLVHDAVMPGAPEFVRWLTQNHHIKIIYLSGRIQERFQDATWDQLQNAGFPGKFEAELILEPELSGLTHDDFKLGVLKSRLQERSILAIFDDSSRNLLAFKQALNPEIQLFRPVRAKSQTHLKPNSIIEILDYQKDFPLLETFFGSGLGCLEFMKKPN